jgi:ankyrin repeat protein
MSLNYSLWNAADKSDLQGVQKFLDCGADVNCDNPLIRASRRKSKTIVELLLNHGAKINQRNLNDGVTSLICASTYGRKNIVELLLNRGAKINQAGSNGHTPLMWASRLATTKKLLSSC